MPTNDPEQHNSPAYWRKRAEDTRLFASRLTDHKTKMTLLEIAASYDELAVLAEAGRIARTNNT
jgi:hypothetical protein